MECAGHVVGMGESKVYTGFWWGNQRERGHFEEPGIDRRIILRWIFRKWDGGVWAGLIWLRIDWWQTLSITVMNLWVPYNTGNFLTSLEPVSLSRTLLHGVSK